jgi:hypothetical protein
VTEEMRQVQYARAHCPRQRERMMVDAAPKLVFLLTAIIVLGALSCYLSKMIK